MKILITGCAGMIGSYLTSDLFRSYPIEKGHKIVGFDKLSRELLTPDLTGEGRTL